jgi:hypothetical protein
MNTSYSKIRHIRESNILLENRRNRSLITEETTSKSFGNLKTIISQSDQDKQTVEFCKKATHKQLCVVSNESGNPMGWVHERQQWNKILNKYGYSSVEGTGYSYATDKNSPGPYSTGQIWNLDTNQPQGNKPAQKVNQNPQNVVQPQGNKPEEKVNQPVQKVNQPVQKVNQPVQNVVQPQNNKPAPNVTQPSKPAQRLPSF